MSLASWQDHCIVVNVIPRVLSLTIIIWPLHVARVCDVLDIFNKEIQITSILKRHQIISYNCCPLEKNGRYLVACMTKLLVNEALYNTHNRIQNLGLEKFNNIYMTTRQLRDHLFTKWTTCGKYFNIKVSRIEVAESTLPTATCLVGCTAWRVKF